MRTRLSFKHGSSADHEALTRLIDEWAGRHLEPMLNKFGFANARMNAMVEKRAKGTARYRVKLHLHVPPKKILVAKADGNDLITITHSALEHIRHELRKHIDRIRHQELYKRKERRKRLHEQKARAAALQTETAAQADSMTEALRPRLERVIRRELAYLRAQGDLPPDYPTVQDVLDEVMLTVKADWCDSDIDGSLYPRMLKAMHEILDHEVDASRVYGQALSLERTPEKDAEDQAEDMVGEEIGEFWQPDEALRLEDVIADSEARDPEQEREEIERAAEALPYLLELMRTLPIDWRRALLLHDVDGVTVEELAICFAQPAETVRNWIGSASAFLDARLEDAGFGTDSRRLLAELHTE